MLETHVCYPHRSFKSGLSAITQWPRVNVAQHSEQRPSCKCLQGYLAGEFQHTLCGGWMCPWVSGRQPQQPLNCNSIEQSEVCAPQCTALASTLGINSRPLRRCASSLFTRCNDTLAAVPGRQQTREKMLLIIDGNRRKTP